MKSDEVQTLPEDAQTKENPSSEILAQWLKHSLDRTFSQLIDENIARLDESELNSHNASEEIFKNISGSSEMLSFRGNLERSIEIALSNILEKETYRNRDDLSAQLSRQIPSSLNKRSFSHVAYLQNILKTPLSEIVSSPTWNDLQTILCEELCHEGNVFNLALQIHARLLSSASPVTVKEGFLNLLEGLSLHYLSHHTFSDLPNWSQGLKFSIHAHYRIIQISQTIVSALCDAPKRWIRFGEKRFEEMIDNFVDMLVMHTFNHVPRKESKNLFFPYHIISTIDPEAVWFKNLMHASYGREITLGSFAKSQSLVRSIVEDVINWLDHHIHDAKIIPSVHDLDTKGAIHSSVIKLATFTHSLSIISAMANFENGWKVFPIQTNLRDEPVSLQEIVILCIQFLNKAPNVEISVKVEDIMANAVVQMMLSKGSNILQSSSPEVIQKLLLPISSSHQFYLEPCVSSIKILCSLADTPQGFNWLLRRSEILRKHRVSTHSSFSSMNESHTPSSQRSSRRNSVRSVSPYTFSLSVVQIAADFATLVLKNEERFIMDPDYMDFIITVLTLSCKLFGQHEGINQLESSKSQLLSYAVSIYQIMGQNKKNIVCAINQANSMPFYHQDVQRALLEFLLRIASTPLGFKHLRSHENLIQSLICDVVDTWNPLNPMDIWTNTSFCRVLQFTDFTDEESLSIRRGLLSKALTNVYTTFESEESLMSGSDELQNKAIEDFKIQLLLVCSSVKVLRALLDEHDDSSTESTLVEGDPPKSLPQLINAAISNYDTSDCLPHWLGLVTLQTLTLNLNFMLLLEARFSFQDALLSLQSKTADELPEALSSPTRDLTNVVWDDCSLLRHQVLKEAFKERFPYEEQTRALSRLSSALSTSPLSPQPAWPIRRMQTELQRFLHDTRPGLHDNTWLGHARRAYRLSAHAEIKVGILLDLLEQVQRCQPLPERPSRSFVWPKMETVDGTDHDIQDKLGADLCLRYGCEQRVIQTSSQQTREQLLLLLTQSRAFLKTNNAEFSYDWFVSSVFLLSGCNIDRSRSLLQRLAPLPSTAFLWSNLSIALRQEDLSAAFGQQLETLVAVHFPNAHNALKIAGVSWWWLSDQLVQQSLWPVMQVQQLSHAIVLCILHSCDFQLLLRIALLAHLQPRLLQAVAQSTNIMTALQRYPQTDFRICDYLPLIDRLAKHCRYPVNRDQT